LRDKFKIKHVKLVFIILLTCIIAGIIAFIYMWINHKQLYSVQTYSMGTFVQQTIHGSDSETAAQKAADSIATLEDEISLKKDGSAIININANAGNVWTTVSSDTISILNDSLDVCRQSSGALDITIAPLSQLWDFDDSPTEPPSDSLIQQLLPKIDYSEVRINTDNSSVSIRDHGYAIDLGSVGKGAACDKAAQIYSEYHIDYGVTAVGGSICLYGNKPFGQKFSVGIQDPFGEHSSTIATLKLNASFVSTSGSYEKTFEYDGKQYFHILDPETGYPVETNLVSVTVVCDKGIISDALSTACFVLGYEKSLDLLSHYNAEAVFIDKDKNVYVTNGLKDVLEITSDEYKISE
jgi:thiamine biosynthesis lipoprotein